MIVEKIIKDKTDEIKKETSVRTQKIYERLRELTQGAIDEAESYKITPYLNQSNEFYSENLIFFKGFKTIQIYLYGFQSISIWVDYKQVKDFPSALIDAKRM